MLLNLVFTNALNSYCAEAVQRKVLTKGSSSSYKTYLNTLEKKNGQQTMTWIKDVIACSKELDTFITTVKQTFTNFVTTNPTAIPVNQTSKIQSAFYSFALYIYSYFNADADMLWSEVSDDLALAKLVASTAIFADNTVVKDVIRGKDGAKVNIPQGNQYASWDCMRSIRNPQYKGQIINGLYCDDNTRANQAIKYAVLHSFKWGRYANISYFRGFEACHVYDLVQDHRFYTSIMNLVLVPRALAALTDHNKYVQDVLKYRVYDLFKFTAAGPVPVMPKNYQNIIWR